MKQFTYGFINAQSFYIVNFWNSLWIKIWCSLKSQISTGSWLPNKNLSYLQFPQRLPHSLSTHIVNLRWSLWSAYRKVWQITNPEVPNLKKFLTHHIFDEEILTINAQTDKYLSDWLKYPRKFEVCKFSKPYREQLKERVSLCKTFEFLSFQ